MRVHCGAVIGAVLSGLCWISEASNAAEIVTRAMCEHERDLESVRINVLEEDIANFKKDYDTLNAKIVAEHQKAIPYFQEFFAKFPDLKNANLHRGNYENPAPGAKEFAEKIKAAIKQAPKKSDGPSTYSNELFSAYYEQDLGLVAKKVGVSSRSGAVVFLSKDKSGKERVVLSISTDLVPNGGRTYDGDLSHPSENGEGRSLALFDLSTGKALDHATYPIWGTQNARTEKASAKEWLKRDERLLTHMKNSQGRDFDKCMAKVQKDERDRAVSDDKSRNQEPSVLQAIPAGKPIATQPAEVSPAK